MRQGKMLTTVAIILTLWALGFIGAHTTGGVIHMALLVVLLVVTWRLLTGRQVMSRARSRR